MKKKSTLGLIGPGIIGYVQLQKGYQQRTKIEMIAVFIWGLMGGTLCKNDSQWY